jgi:hypothetical protein
MQYATCWPLPPDNVGAGGFDNIADVLAVSPLLMEQYLLVAGKISRLAVGPGSISPASETYFVSGDYFQDARADEDLPFRSRGGTVVTHRFPLDGEYAINVTLHKNQEGYIRGLRREHRLDIRVDHEQVGLLKVGGEVHGRSGPVFSQQNPHWSGDLDQVGYEFMADQALKVRFTAKAGTRLVGVSFLQEKSKPTGFLAPSLKLSDIEHYKGGDPAIESLTITGPFTASGPGDTASRREIFICYPASLAEAEPCAKAILSGLARSAYRRQVVAEDIDKLLVLYRTGRDQGGFETGIELALQGILTSPEFLFRVEREPPQTVAGQIYPVSDIELASRLSFFLWSSIPDEELLSLAEHNRLREPGVLAQQVRRMLADPRAGALVENFGEQFLALRQVDLAEPHPGIFLDFDEELRDAFKQETALWFKSMIVEDRSILELLTSDYTYLNERLARHYGIPGIYGSRFRPVDLKGFEERQGLLGKGSILLATSYNNRTSPVLRGKWVLENLLTMPPPPPPDDVFEPPLEEKNNDGRTLTMREAMEQHRANPVCAACHKLMDPIGFALEKFDVIGSARTVYADAGTGIDTSGVLFDGNAFEDTAGFRDQLLKHSDRVVYTVALKLLTYAIGRGVEHYDQPAIREMVQKTAPANYSWSALIQAVVDSKPFQYRKAYAGTAAVSVNQ